MLFTVKEMNVLCIFHAGTRSATLGLLRESEKSKKETPERMAIIKSIIKKLSDMENDGVVSLEFEPEK